MDYLLRLPQAAPYAVSRFGSGKVQQRLKRCLTEQRPDVVVCDFLDAAVKRPRDAASYLRNIHALIRRLERTRPANCVLERSMREVGHPDDEADRARRAKKGDQPADRRHQQADQVVEVLWDCLPGCGGLWRSRLTTTQPLVR